MFFLVLYNLMSFFLFLCLPQKEYIVLFVFIWITANVLYLEIYLVLDEVRKETSKIKEMISVIMDRESMK